MLKNAFNKNNHFNLALLLGLCVGAVCLLGYNYTYELVVKNESLKIGQLIEVIWPLENASLIEEQIFAASLPSTYKEGVRMSWGVEGGVLEGEMRHKVNNLFEASVDVNKWDWKKDNKYVVTFSARDSQNNLIATTSIFVYVGEGLDENIASVDVATLDTPKTEPVSNAAAVYAPLIKKSATTTPKATSAASTFSVEWKLSDIKNNQKFNYKFTGFNPSDVSAFWQSEGGHKNIVFNSDPNTPFSAAINIFGWRWKDKGPYKITFGITDKNTSAVLATEDFELFWKGEPGNSEIELRSRGALIATTSATPRAVNVDASKTEIKDVVVDVTKPIALISLDSAVNQSRFTKSKLFASNKPAVNSALAGLTAQADIKAIKYILEQPNSVWLNGDSYEDEAYIQGIIKSAKDKNQIPAFVLYNIPNRDCGSYSSGGTDTIENYKIWIDKVAKNFVGEEVIVVVEPDALAQLNCIPEKDRSGRIEMLKYAVEKTAAVSTLAMVYIDAGHPYWVNGDEMAARLRAVGVAKARGFALNVSSYASTEDNITYGNHISNLLGGKKYVIDTSRNGNGTSPTREWCNPSGRALGDSPVLLNGTLGAVDALLWIKFPGESDGYCNGGPNAGGFWTEYAIGLYKNR